MRSVTTTCCGRRRSGSASPTRRPSRRRAPPPTRSSRYARAVRPYARFRNGSRTSSTPRQSRCERPSGGSRARVGLRRRWSDDRRGHEGLALLPRARRRRDRRALLVRSERRRDERHPRREQREGAEQRVDLRRGGAGGRRVLRAFDGVHQRAQPAQPCVAPKRIPAHPRAAWRVDRSERHDRRRDHARRVRVRGRRGGRDHRRAGLRVDGRSAGASHRLDVPVRRAAPGQRRRHVRGVRLELRAGWRRHPTHGRAAMSGPTPLASGPVRVALVGCGRISRNHFDAIQRIDELQLVAVADSDLARAQGIATEQGVPAFGSLDEMLSTVPSDLVAICTPSGLHPQHGIAAARAGRQVLTEKPMAISLAAADELVQACDTAGVQLFVVKQNRLNPAIQLLRRAVDKGRFGRIYSANTTVRWTRPQEYYDAEPWRGTWEFDGGAIMNQASHYVDLMQWLVGPVESILAKTATQARRIEAEDSGIGILKFRSGALGVIEVNVLTYPKNLEGSITILGEKGSVKIGGTAVNKVETWLFADYDDDDKLIEAASTNPPNVYGFGHEGYYRNVLKVLRGEARADTDGRAGRKSLELILGIYESAKTGCEVPIPLRTRL